MAQSKLPLKIKVDVRDHFDAPTCSVQEAFSNLEEVIGLKKSCKVEWDLLWNSLESNFPDKTTFVPTVAGIVAAWCNTLSARLEDDRFAAWTENVIGRLETVRAVKLRIQVADGDRPTTLWSADQSSFVLTLPRANNFTTPNTITSGFGTDFSNMFNPTPTSSALPNRTANDNNGEDQWAEIDEAAPATPTTTRSSVLFTPAPSIYTTATTPTPDTLPSIPTLPTPEVLLRTLTPYILHVTHQGGAMYGKVIVQCTHEPSLKFLNDYLVRWIKRDHQDVRKVPLLSMTLHELHFGMGLCYDALTIEPYDTNQERRGIGMNVAVVLALVENVLGYRRLPNVSAGFWEFRRDVPFK